MNVKRTIFALQLLLASNLLTHAAEDGKQLYGQMCAACHGNKGQGLGNGVFPPLAGSEWLQGDPNRIAQVLLHGLIGPVTVKGKTYNLAMPAQGSLSDEGKVAVIRYIKKEFAGEETDFSLTDLNETKQAHKDRTVQWTAKELLKHYPLPVVKSPISNLIMEVYHGKWTTMPDFSKLQAVAIEEEHDGFISLRSINKKHSFALVWLGDIEVPSDGTYQFELMADDSAVVIIGDQEVSRVKGLGPVSDKRASRGKIALKKGSHKIKVKYLQYMHSKGISLNWTNLAAENKNKVSQSLTAKDAAPRRAAVVIDLTPTDGKTRMYRNFIKGSTHRTMGVGFPQGHNIAFSTQDCQPDLIWKGKFINAGRHWSGRGQGPQDPLSNDVVKLGQGVALSDNGEDIELKLTGYTMDEMGNPSFSYKGHSTNFNEQYVSSEKSLTRIITINSFQDYPLRIRLAKIQHVLTKQGAIVDNKLLINASSMNSEGDELFSNLDVKKGTQTFKIIYSWKK